MLANFGRKTTVRKGKWTRSREMSLEVRDSQRGKTMAEIRVDFSLQNGAIRPTSEHAAEKHFRSQRSQRCSCWRSEPPPAFTFRRLQKTRRQFRAGTRINLSSRKMEYNSSNQQKDIATHRPRSQSQPNHRRVRTDCRNGPDQSLNACRRGFEDRWGHRALPPPWPLLTKYLRRFAQPESYADAPLFHSRYSRDLR